MKLALGFIIALFLSLQDASAQSSSSVTEIPDTEVNSTLALDGDQSASSGSGIDFGSGDDHNSSVSTVLATGKLKDENTSTSLPFVPLNSNEINEISGNNVSSSVRPILDLSNSTTNETDLDPNNSTDATPETSLSNYTTAVTFTGNYTTTRSPQVQNSTKPFTKNTTNTTLPATSTSPMNESSTERTFPTAVLPSNDTFTNATAIPTKEDSHPATEFISEINRTAGSFDVRGETDRGLSSESNDHHKNQAWGAFLGVTIAVAIVAMVIYVIQKRSYRDFSHTKLVEEPTQDPVQHLDNSEPLDFKHGGFAYYNPGLQGDNIQMTNFPRGQYN